MIISCQLEPIDDCVIIARVHLIVTVNYYCCFAFWKICDNENEAKPYQRIIIEHFK